MSLDRLYIAVPVSLLIWCWDWVQGQGGDPQHATAQEPFCRPFLGQNHFWLLFYHRVTFQNAIGKFFSPHFTFLWSFGFSSAPTQWVLLTVFAQIGKKWNSQQSNSYHFFWLFMFTIWSMPPKKYKKKHHRWPTCPTWLTSSWGRRSWAQRLALPQLVEFFRWTIRL